MHRSFPLWILSTAIVVQSQVAAYGVMIDDFSVGPIVVSGPSGSANQVDLDPAHVIGGRRSISVDSSGSVAQVDVASGRLEFSNTQLGYYKVMYGLGNPLGQDFTVDGHDRIRFRFADAGPLGILWSYVNTPLPPSGSGVDLSGGTYNVAGVRIIEVPFTRYNTDVHNVNTFALYNIRKPIGVYCIEEIVTAAAPIPGDYNRDGQVNAADYDDWRVLFGRSVGGGIIFGSDGNADGLIDGRDFVLWRKNVSMPVDRGDSVGVTPEPFWYLLAAWPAVSCAACCRMRLRRERCYDTPIDTSNRSILD